MHTSSQFFFFYNFIVIQKEHIEQPSLGRCVELEKRINTKLRRKSGLGGYAFAIF